MLTSAIYSRVIGLPERLSFEPERLAKGMAIGSFRLEDVHLEDVHAEVHGWKTKLFAWKTPTYMTFGEAEWVPAVPPTTLSFREGIGVFTRDGWPPLLATISPLLVMTRALTSSIPRHLKELTGEAVSVTAISLRLERLLRNSDKFQLRGLEWVPQVGLVSSHSAISEQKLPSPPDDFIHKFGEAVTAYNMIWQGLDVTLRRDFSIEIATVDATLDQVAEGMAELVATLIESEILG
jgi:hypothetical protein